MHASAVPDEPLPIGEVNARHSLRTRMLLSGTVAQALMLIGLAALLYLGARMTILHNAYKQTSELAQQVGHGLDATLASVQVSGHILAANVGGAGHQPFLLRSLLLGTLAGDHDIAGATVVVEPGGFKDDSPYFVWHVERVGAQVQEKNLGNLKIDYRNQPWYQRTLHSDQAWWSEPFPNGDVSGQYLSTYNLPLHLPGDAPDAAPIGMVGVDVPISRLRAVVRELPADTGLQPMLISPDGLIVIDHDPSLQFRRDLATQVDLRRPDLAPMLEAVANHQATSFEHHIADEHFLTHVIPVGTTGWTFALSVSQDFALAGLNHVAMVAAIAGGLALLAWMALVWRYARTLARPIEDITDSAQHFHRGEFEYPLQHLERDDEVGVMARAFDAARSSIRRQMDEIGQMTAARERLQSELEIARDIQLAMLPPGRTFDGTGTHLEAFALLEPAKTVGGDFYHFLESEPGRLWFVIGDVSDKGVPAALFMARATTVLEIAARRDHTPDEILKDAAQWLVEHNDTCMFATVLCGVIDAHTGDYWLASAGHEPPVLVHSDGSAEELPLVTGPALGIEPTATFEVLSGRLLDGQTLVGYTDGVTDALSPAEENYGLPRLLQALSGGRSAHQQCMAVIDDLRRFIGDAEPFDDITLLAIRLREPTTPAAKPASSVAVELP